MTANEEDFDSWLNEQAGDALQAIDRTHNQARADLYKDEDAADREQGSGQRRSRDNS